MQVHNISDILGGFLVAIIFTTPFAVKAIGLHSCIKHLIDDAPAEDTDGRKGRVGAVGGGPARPAATVGGTAVQDGHVVGGQQHQQHYHHRNGKRDQQQQRPGPGEQLVLDVAPTGDRR